MNLRARLLPYAGPKDIPLSFRYGEREIKGLPADFAPEVHRRTIDSNISQIIVCGQNSEGLAVRVEYIEYKDFPVTEWVAFIKNNGDCNTPILSEIKIVNGAFNGKNPILVHSNGDSLNESGFEIFTDKLAEKMTLAPSDGTPCRDAAPYMRLMFSDYGINIAIGWPAQWEASFTPASDGVSFTAGQQRTHMYLKPNEEIRTPRINLMGFEGGEINGANLWRKWYFKHILPKENGAPLPPKLCAHTWKINGTPEFTSVTEKNQIDAIDDYIDKGLKPDVWWIDAGWYPCDFDWCKIGTWAPNPAHLPNGFKAISEKCEENNIKLLLWFEPERVRADTEFYSKYRDKILFMYTEDGKEYDDNLLNLGDRETCDMVIELVDKFIKDNHIHIYRQDFNFMPLPVWVKYEEADRIGALENFHAQGYLRYWDELLLRNPGLIIDSCAAGGRRNDLETMRRAVALHYTDVGYGNHPIKQKQYRYMLSWLPYFRSHTMSWDNEDGSYGAENRPVDSFAYYCAIAPAVTFTIEHDAGAADFELAAKMHKIWRKAAEIMLSGDYFPLSECNKRATDYYAVQFNDNTLKRGFIQIIRNINASEDSYTVTPQTDINAVYSFTNYEDGAKTSMTGSDLANGFTVSIPARSGVIWFYNYN